MKNLILFASIAMASGLLLTNIYNSLIDTRAWGADLPNSIETARQYYKVVTPGNFYRIFSPVNQILALLAVILLWKAFPSVRLYVCAALVLYVITDVFTFAYFYPRNDIMFVNDISNIDAIKKAWQEWNMMNWLRSGILLGGLVCSSIALHKTYTAVSQ